jgi:hypothetical protein
VVERGAGRHWQPWTLQLANERGDRPHIKRDRSTALDVVNLILIIVYLKVFIKPSCLVVQFTNYSWLNREKWLPVAVTGNLETLATFLT